jgi:hypothetical protein
MCVFYVFRTKIFVTEVKIIILLFIIFTIHSLDSTSSEPILDTGVRIQTDKPIDRQTPIRTKNKHKQTKF